MGHHFLSTMFTSAFTKSFSRSNLAMSVCPFSAEKINAVLPLGKNLRSCNTSSKEDGSGCLEKCKNKALIP